MTEKLVDHPERVFQIWGYSVSMRRLLLRSNKGNSFHTRLDVLFQNVSAICLSTSLEGLVVTVGSVETEEISALTGLLPDSETRFFSVISSVGKGYVVAGVVAAVEDTGDYLEPSKLWAGAGGGGLG